jgi:hypothetical protein
VDAAASIADKVSVCGHQAVCNKVSGRSRVPGPCLASTFKRRDYNAIFDVYSESLHTPDAFRHLLVEPTALVNER